jgi:hypothetical protein
VRPYLKKTPHKNRAGGVAQGVAPEFKPQYHLKRAGGVAQVVVLGFNLQHHKKIFKCNKNIKIFHSSWGKDQGVKVSINE